MNSITRNGIRSEYIAPENVPSFSRRWQRAMSALNAADDQRYLVDATSQDGAEARSVLEFKLTEQDSGKYHADLALLSSRRSSRLTAPRKFEPISGSIVTNGPNTQPAAHSSFAVGPEVAA